MLVNMAGIKDFGKTLQMSNTGNFLIQMGQTQTNTTYCTDLYVADINQKLTLQWNPYY